MKVHDFLLTGYDFGDVESGQFSWQSPSNIALVKYWGKTDPQIPKNPSISFTLSESFTRTTLEFHKKKTSSKAVKLEVIFEGEKKEAFKPKIITFFKRIGQYVPFINAYDFVIRTENSFPHSSGIASSASGLSALALCIMSMEKALNPEISDQYFKQKASFLARLGSGSAARSIDGPVVVWGAHPGIPGSSDLYGIPFPFKLHPVFKNYQDTILLVDKGEKQVSSTLGHNLMNDHPFAAQRFVQANENTGKLTGILQNGNLDAFVALVEAEALSLHAMMMTSVPNFILMKPNTLKIIEKIRQYREDHHSHICFTLDAGANVHVLFPEREKEKVSKFIANKLAPYCQNKQYICDYTGSGAKPV